MHLVYCSRVKHMSGDVRCWWYLEQTFSMKKENVFLITPVINRKLQKKSTASQVFLLRNRSKETFETEIFRQLVFTNLAWVNLSKLVAWFERRLRNVTGLITVLPTTFRLSVRLGLQVLVWVCSLAYYFSAHVYSLLRQIMGEIIHNQFSPHHQNFFNHLWTNE